MEFASPYLKYVWTSWRDGGWIMIALVLLAFIIHVVAIRMIQVIRCYRDVHTIENLESFLRTPGDAPPALRSLFAYLSPHPNESIDLPSRVYEVQHAIVSPLNQNKMLLAVLVSTAPLLGLLGTVMGLLTTFEALSSGNDEAIAVIADGIAAALITTETGLLIAIPGYFMLLLTKRRIESLELFFAKLQALSITPQGATRSPKPIAISQKATPSSKPITVAQDPILVHDEASLSVG